jgi:hypothetical protein
MKRDAAAPAAPFLAHHCGLSAPAQLRARDDDVRIYLHVGAIPQLLIADLDRQITERHARAAADIVLLVPWETAALEKFG